MKNIKNTISKLSILILTIACFSCTESEIMSKYHFNDVQEFRVQVEGQTIYADINENDITINWPQSIKKPETITPTIIVSDKAHVVPASRTEITFKDKVAFVVTAEDGTAKTYNLKIETLHPNLKIEEAETQITANYTYSYTILGEGFSKNPAENKAFLVSHDGTETPIKVTEVQTRNDNGYGDGLVLRMPKKADLPEGHYKVKVAFGRKSATTANAYFELKDLKLPMFSEIAENQIVEKNGVRCIVVKQNQEVFLKGENLDALQLNQMFVTYTNNSGAGTTSVNVRLVDNTTIAFSPTFWNTRNFAYQKAYVSFNKPDTWKTIKLYLYDTKGELVGVYFEQ